MSAPDRHTPPWGVGVSWGAGVAPFLTLGLELALAVVAFFFLGRWLDQRWGTSPWLMIAGLAVGFAGGFINFLRTALAIGRRQDRVDQERKTES